MADVPQVRAAASQFSAVLPALHARFRQKVAEAARRRRWLRRRPRRRYCRAPREPWHAHGHWGAGDLLPCSP